MAARVREEAVPAVPANQSSVNKPQPQPQRRGDLLLTSHSMSFVRFGFAFSVVRRGNPSLFPCFSLTLFHTLSLPPSFTFPLAHYFLVLFFFTWSWWPFFSCPTHSFSMSPSQRAIQSNCFVLMGVTPCHCNLLTPMMLVARSWGRTQSTKAGVRREGTPPPTEKQV